MDTILHILGICGDHKSHISLISALSEMQYLLIYLKNYFRL
jgi:hypothetical protein